MAKDTGGGRGPGEWMIPAHLLEASRRPDPPVRPVTPEDMGADDLAALLDVPGPVLVIDGDEARQAWNALQADVSIPTTSPTSTAMVVNSRRAAGSTKLLLLDTTTPGCLSPHVLLGNDMSTLRVAILAAQGTELSDVRAALCRVVRVLPSPRPAP